MGPTLTALLDLQDIDRDLYRLRRRMRTRTIAVTAQEKKISKLNQDKSLLEESSIAKRKSADEMELNLQAVNERVEKLKGDLNTAKTNKEYATLLTEINTLKADNSNAEELALKTISEADEIKTQIAAIDETLVEENQKLQAVQATNADEITRLEEMIAKLQEKRDQAALKVPAEILTQFNILVEKYEGEAMANIEISGARQPYTYTCGGCFMQLTAEHANALASKDEVRQCDNCKRMLYILEVEDDGF